ncbi:MAG: hypothetical protein JW717_10910 [Marinilabiliaceae bacterium]|nr:hypothetical protein [Marinilabiliaceae bacterium]
MLPFFKKNSFFIIFILSILTVNTNTVSQEFFSKHEEKNFSGNDIRVLSIDNPCGNISVKGWNYDSIAVSTNINIETKSNNTANEIIDNLILTTEKQGTSFKIAWKVKNDVKLNTPVIINYTIHTPNSLIIKIVGSHGKLIAEQLSNETQIFFEHGSVSVNNINTTSKNIFTLKACDATFNNIKNCQIIGDNNNIQIQNCSYLNIKTNYSSASLNNIENLLINGEHIKCNISNIDQLEMHAFNCQADITKLNRYGLIEINTGNLTLSKLSNSLTELNVANTNAPLVLFINENMPFFINGQTQQGFFNYPWNKKIKIIRDISTISFSGHNAEVNNMSTKLILFNKQASIEIKKE